MTDKIVDHIKITSRSHLYTKARELLFRVFWYDYNTGSNKWEPTRRVTRGEILSYYQTKKLLTLDSIDQAKEELFMNIPLPTCSLAV